MKSVHQESISLRGRMFHDHLIEEFRVDETLGFDSLTAPKSSTAELINSKEVDIFKNFLLKTPNQLVRFKIFKRSAEQQGDHVDKPQAKKKLIRRRATASSLDLSAWALWVTTRGWFDAFIFFFILLSTITQGVQTQLDPADAPLLFDIMDILDDLALIVFSLEIAIKWLYSFEKFWYDGWNVFDFAATMLSAVPRIIELILGGASGVGSIGVQLRLFRTMRVLKMVARVHTLRLVINAAIEAFSALGWILLLLLLLTYMFGIFSINLFYPYTTSLSPDLVYQDKFKDLPSAFITLFQLLTLDQWFSIQADIQKVVSPVVVVSFFIFWVWIGAFVFRNVFVGVMVRKFDDIHMQMRKAAEIRRKQEAKKRAMAKLQRQLLAQQHGEEWDMDSDSDIKGDDSESHESDIDSETRSSTPGSVSQSQPLLSQRRMMASITKAKSKHNLKKGLSAANLIGDERKQMDDWVKVVTGTLESLKDENKEYVWPRDALFRYLTCMKQMQNNMREYEELQYLASLALVSLSEDNVS